MSGTKTGGPCPRRSCPAAARNACGSGAPHGRAGGPGPLACRGRCPGLPSLAHISHTSGWLPPEADVLFGWTPTCNRSFAKAVDVDIDVGVQSTNLEQTTMWSGNFQKRQIFQTRKSRKCVLVGHFRALLYSAGVCSLVPSPVRRMNPFLRFAREYLPLLGGAKLLPVSNTPLHQAEHDVLTGS